MKQTILIAALFFSMSVTLHAQSNMQNENAEQAVSKVLQQMADAFTKNDASIFEKCYADTYIFTDPAGFVHNKKNMVDYAKACNYKFESVIPSDRKVSVYENMAVATEHTTEKGHVGDTDISGEYGWMYIFHKEGDDWKIVAMQGTRMEQ